MGDLGKRIVLRGKMNKEHFEKGKSGNDNSEKETPEQLQSREGNNKHIYEHRNLETGAVLKRNIYKRTILKRKKKDTLEKETSEQKQFRKEIHVTTNILSRNNLQKDNSEGKKNIWKMTILESKI